MNENSSKQVLLSVLGIAVLVIAVVGVSFAFFTYSRTGTTNNQLTTGSIYFSFTEGDQINLTNQFPLSDAQGSAIVPAEGDNAVLNFSVIGYDGSGKGIEYTIYAVKGDAYTGTDSATRTTTLYDNEIKLKLTPAAGTSPVSNNFASPAFVSSASSTLETPVELATGKITETAASSQQTDTYELRMWISSDSVKIISGDGAVTDRSTHTYEMEDFGKTYYYSLKIKVVAATTDTTQPTA